MAESCEGSAVADSSDSWQRIYLIIYEGYCAMIPTGTTDRWLSKWYGFIHSKRYGILWRYVSDAIGDGKKPLDHKKTGNIFGVLYDAAFPKAAPGDRDAFMRDNEEKVRWFHEYVLSKCSSGIEGKQDEMKEGQMGTDCQKPVETVVQPEGGIGETCEKRMNKPVGAERQKSLVDALKCHIECAYITLAAIDKVGLDLPGQTDSIRGI